MSFKEQRCLTTVITDIKMLSKFCSCTAHHKIPCISQHNRWYLGRRKKRAELGLSCGKSCYWPEITALSWENPRLSRQVGAWPHSGKRTGWKSGRMGRERRERAPRGANAPIPGHSWSPPWLTGCCAWACIQHSPWRDRPGTAWHLPAQSFPDSSVHSQACAAQLQSSTHVIIHKPAVTLTADTELIII